MAADGSITIDTKIDSKNLKKDLEGIKNSLGKGLKVAAKGAAIAIAAIAASIALVAKGAKEFSAITDRIDKMSQKIGISRQAFQEWDYILSQSGADVSMLQMSIKTLSKAADEAAQGTATYAESFDRLGVSVLDANGNLKDSETLFNESFKALSSLDNETERTAIASELLGRSATELAPAFNQGAEAIEAMRQEAHDLGLVMSDDVINAGVVLTDSMDRLKRIGKGLFIEVFSGIVPVLNDLLSKFTEFVKGAGGIQGIVSSIGDFFRNIGLEIKISWIRTIDTLRLYWYRWIQGFRVDAANMQIAFVYATQGIKIAIFSLSAVIYDKLLGAISDLMKSLSWVPFIGDNFVEASNKLSQFNDVLQEGYASDIQAGKDMISQAKANRDAIIDEIDGEMAARKEATEQKIDDLRELSEAEKKAREEERAVENERQIAEAKAAQAAKEKLERLQQLAAIDASYSQEMAKNQQKYELGLTTQEELIGNNISAMESYIESLIDMGVTAESSAEEGGAALKKMLKLLSDEKLKLEAKDDGGDTGISFMEGLLSGIKETGPKVLSTAKSVISSIAGIVSGVVSGISSAISWAAAFDVTELWDTFAELIDGIKNFFMVDLPSLPIYLEAGAAMVQDLVSGIRENWDSISETISNVISTLVTVIMENLPDILQIGEDVLLTFLRGIQANVSGVRKTIKYVITILIDAFVKSLPYIISLGGELIMALLEGLSANAEALAEGLGEAVAAMIEFVGSNADEMVDLGIKLIQGLVLGIVKALPDIVKALAKAAPYIMLEFYLLPYKMAALAPEIIWALITGMVEALIETPGILISAIIDVFTKFIDAILSFFGIHSPSKVFADIGVNLIQGLINGILNAGATIWNAVKSVFTGLWDNIVNIFSGALSFGASIVNNISSGINSVLGTVGSAVSGAASSIWGGITSAASSVGSWISGWFANGTDYAPGGLSIVGEEGPEIVNLPRGSKVWSNDETEKILSAGTSAVTSFGAASMGMQNISVYVNGTMEVDGKEIGRISYEYMDEIAAGA